MFESISYRKSPYTQNNFDLGLFAECLLFYNKVSMLADEGLLTTLIQNVGLDHFEHLIKTEKIAIVFTPWHYGTRTFNENTRNEYFDYCSFAKVPAKSDQPDVESLFFAALERGSHKKGKSRRVGRRTYENIRIFESNKKGPIDKGIPEVARKSLENKNYVQKALVTTINHYAPQYPIDEKFYFFVERHSKGFNIITNIEIEKLNRMGVESGNIHPENKIGKAHIIDHLLKVELELFISSYMNSEITTDVIHSSLIELKCEDILKKITKNQRQVDLFQNIVFEDGKAIRESINNGQSSFESIFPLLEESEKYHKWVNSLGNNRNLVREYYKELTSKSWIDKLPSKSVRFSLFTGAGFLIDAVCPTGLGTAAGVALSIGDAFLLDNIIKGWKPNQYIEKIQKIKNAQQNAQR